MVACLYVFEVGNKRGRIVKRERGRKKERMKGSLDKMAPVMALVEKEMEDRST